jgi:hypothetical protein
MAPSKKRKLIVCVLGLAVAALLADRALLGSGKPGPKEAVAEPSAAPAAAPNAPGQSPVAPPRQSRETVQESLACRLKAVSEADGFDSANVRDAFCLSPAWTKDLGPAAPSSPQQDKAEQLKMDHQLVAVMMAGEGGYAIVDGKCLRIGQVLDGFTLISVTDKSAVLESDGIRVELKVPSTEDEEGLGKSGNG